MSVSLSSLTENTPHRTDVPGPDGTAVPVCLVRVGDDVKAIHDTCSHQEFSLAEGMVYDGAVECDLHGSCFDLETGKPTSLPAVRPVPTYAVAIDGDTVTVDVTTTLNGADAPDH